MNPKKLPLMIFGLVVFFAPVFAFAESTTSSEFVAYQREWVSQVASLNLGYLTLAITALLASAGFYQFFSIKPSQDEIKRLGENFAISEEKLRIFQRQLQVAIAGFKESNKKREEELAFLKQETKSDIKDQIGIAEKKLEEIRKEAAEEAKQLKSEISFQRVINEWDSHYIWKLQNVPINVLRSLTSALEREVEHKNLYGTTLTNKAHQNFIGAILEDIISCLGKPDAEIDEKIKETLTKTLEKLNEHDSKKGILQGLIANVKVRHRRVSDDDTKQE